ncbi:MAG: CopG family transcriptional regulator [Bryobacteraceae bacterium]|jgi:predicted transcriptional regulator
MEVHFTPEQEAQLSQIANHNGTPPEQLVREAVTRMLENQARFIAGVQKGIAAAERGEFVEHDEVKNRINRLFQS